MSIPELRNFEYIFTDINADNLEKTRALCQRDIDGNGINKTIIATTNRREALKDARYIINLIRVGGLEAFETDIDIPLKYGVDQCVGDTLCIGGNHVWATSNRDNVRYLSRYSRSYRKGCFVTKLF